MVLRATEVKPTATIYVHYTDITLHSTRAFCSFFCLMELLNSCDCDISVMQTLYIFCRKGELVFAQAPFFSFLRTLVPVKPRQPEENVVVTVYHRHLL